jgi:Leucine-rich repeat (LRR) protein
VNLEHSQIRGFLLGSIPSSIGNLVNLKFLDLSLPQDYPTLFDPALPSELESLRHLLSLSIVAPFDFRDRSPGIPAGTMPTILGKLSNLTYLSLVGINYNGTIPTELGKLTSLKDLHLKDLSALWTDTDRVWKFARIDFDLT